MLSIIMLFGTSCASLDKSRHMSGMFSYMADSAMFIECQTGKKLALLFEDDYISLEKAYLETKKEDAESLKVDIFGRVVLRYDKEMQRDIFMLLVDRFISIEPTKKCKIVEKNRL